MALMLKYKMSLKMWMGIVMTIVPKYNLCMENIKNINGKRKWILLTKSAYTKSVVSQAI